MAAVVIQKTIDGNITDCPAENSTIYRWIREFRNASHQVNGALLSLWMILKRIHRELLLNRSLLEQIREFRPENWYSFVTVLLVNAGYGTYTIPSLRLVRHSAMISCFCTGKEDDHL